MKCGDDQDLTILILVKSASQNAQRCKGVQKINADEFEQAYAEVEAPAFAGVAA